VHTTVAEILLRELKTSGDTKKRALYQACQDNRPIEYPLGITLPDLASPSLLDRVQNSLDVEVQLRVFRRRRTNGRDSAVYIPPQAKASLQATDDTRFPLMGRVKEFLGGDQKVLLLLGESGAGKSTFSSELEFDLWQSYKGKTGRIPLHINLPAIDKPEHDMIAKQLRMDEFTEHQIREMKHYRKFILICDGYDECQQTRNLYMSNRLNQPGEWDVQMVICCRREYLGSDYRDRFQPGNRNQLMDSPLFQEAVFTPFSVDQIEAYLEQYVSMYKPLWGVKDYKKAIDLIPSLKDLVKNPFLMALSLDVLPRMVGSEQRPSSVRVTRVALYDLFIEQWLERGRKRLSEKDLIPQAKEAFEKLCSEGFTLHGFRYLKRLAIAIYKEQDGHPVLKYSQLTEKDALLCRTEKQLLLEACPLTRNGNQYQFLHQSILEYLLAHVVFDPKDRMNSAALEPVLRLRVESSTKSFETNGSDEETKANLRQEPDPNSPLVWKSFVKEHSLLHFLEERVHQEQVFKDQLMMYIEHSKEDMKWSIAAANAITILVRAGVQFINRDLRGVQIPGADLSYGVFDSVDLQEADMRGVNLRGAWLRESELSGADMTGVQFGELPFLTMCSDVCSCAFSPDGTSFAVGLGIGDIRVYSTSTWEMIRALTDHDIGTLHIAFSPDGNLIVSGSRDKTVRLWSMESGVCQHVLTDHIDGIICVAYSPRGDQVASASCDKTIRLWNPTTGSCCHIISGMEDIANCVVYSPGGDQIAIGGDDCTVRLWNVVTEDYSHIFVAHSDKVRSLAFSPRGDQIASASWDDTIRLWDVESGKCRHTLEGHTDFVNDVVYSLKGDQVFSGSSDGTVRAWDVQSGTCNNRLTGHGDVILCVAFSPKGDMVASGSYDRTVGLWDVLAGESQHISNGHSQEVTNIKCSRKGDVIATSSLDNTVRLWDVETGACLRTFSRSSRASRVTFPQEDQIGPRGSDIAEWIWGADLGAFRDAYSPQGDQVASASYGKTVRLWNATTGERRGSLNGHTDTVMSVAYSYDGSLIATSSKDHTVRLWNVRTMACINILIGHAGWVGDVVFSPQGGLLASASADCTVRLWSVATGECCLILTGHEDGVLRVAYSHKGDVLASSSEDNTMRLWDMASGQCRAVVQTFRGPLLCVAWIPSTDANYLITGCRDGSVHKWQLVEEEEQYHLKLRWSITNGSLMVEGTSIDLVQGLTRLNKKLLKQRGIVCWPDLYERQGTLSSKNTATPFSQRLQRRAIIVLGVAMLSVALLVLQLIVLAKVFSILVKDDKWTSIALFYGQSSQ